MHTYKNNGSNTITYKGITWEPGEEHAVSFFVPYSELGLTKTGDVMWNASPTAGGTVGWVCVSSGSPGTWKAFGTIAS